MTEKKAVNYLKKNNLLAPVCAKEYPVKSSVTVKETVKYDTVEVPGGMVKVVDTVPCPDGTLIPVEYNKRCPPVEVQYKTVYRDSTIVQENTAAVEAAKDEAAAERLLRYKAENERDKAKDSARIGWLAFAGLLGVNLLLMLVQGKLSWITKIFK